MSELPRRFPLRTPCHGPREGFYQAITEFESKYTLFLRNERAFWTAGIS